MGQGQDSSLSGGYSGDTNAPQYGGFQIDNPGPGVSSGGTAGGPKEPSFWDQFSQAINDPETVKAFSNIAKAHAGMTKARNDLSPHAQQVLKSGLQEFQQYKQRQAAERGITPYMGDAEKFKASLPPEVAQAALRRLGIPGMLKY